MVSGAKQAWSRIWGRLGRLWWEGMCAHARHALRDEVEALERVKCTAARGGRPCVNSVDGARGRRVFH